jgi:hypothetical protein
LTGAIEYAKKGAAILLWQDTWRFKATCST